MVKGQFFFFFFFGNGYIRLWNTLPKRERKEIL